MYTLDLATLLQLLGEFHRNGILRTELLPSLPGLNRRCSVEVELKDGIMVTCSVKDAQGYVLLADQKAFQAVSAAGNLDWIFEDAPPQETSGTMMQRQPSGPLPPPSRRVTDPLRQPSGPLPPPSRRVTDPLRQPNSLHQSTEPLPPPPLSSQPTSPLPAQPTTLYASSIPQQRLYLSNADINHWPRKYRQVYSLIDGERTIAKIAAMLSLPRQTVADVLRDLQASNIIMLI